MIAFDSLSSEMRCKEGKNTIKGVIGAHTVVITLKIRHIFRLTASISFKILFCMTHRNQLVIDCVQEQSRYTSLRRWLARVQRIEVKSTSFLRHLHADLWPEHLHETFRWHSRHDFSYHSLGNVFEATEGTIDDHAGNRYRRIRLIVSQGCCSTHTSTPQSDFRRTSSLS